MSPSPPPCPENLAGLLAADRFGRLAGIELVAVEPGRATARLRLTPTHWNGVGIAHGGALFTLADVAFAAASNARGRVAVAVQASVSFLKATSEGTLTAEAREVACGHKLGTYVVEVKNEAGELVALFQGTAYRKSEALST